MVNFSYHNKIFIKISVKQKIGLVILGLFLSIVILEVGLRMGGLILLSLQERRNKISLNRRGDIVILCLGESTTARGGKNSWPDQLEEILNKKNIEIKFNVINKGVEGVDTGVILSTLEENMDRYNPGIVITMLGINDQPGTVLYEDSPDIKIKLFFKEFRVYKLSKILSQRIVNKINNMISTRTMTGLMEMQNLKKMPSAPEQYEKLKDRLKEMYSQGKYLEAGKILEKLIEIIKGDRLYDLYIGLASCYKMQERYEEAEKLLKKAIEINPENNWAYTDLVILYRDQRRFKEAVKHFKKINNNSSLDYGFYIEIGYCYRDMGEYGKAEQMFKKALEINPKYEPAYTELGGLFIEQARSNDINELAEKIIKERLENDRLYGFIAAVYMKQCKYNESAEYLEKANEFRLKYYNPITRHNYQKLKEIVTQRGIKLVCVQYPMRSIKPLKKIFDSTEGIIFVDNEKIFKDALKGAKYEDYFTDNFGGDFGHCNRKGNRLLAVNVANVILKEYFSK